jgi:predicted DNA-binding transcriptional regulator AlpA
MKPETAKRFLKVEEFAQMFDVNKQRAYEILRRNPSIVVKLGNRQIRVDSEKLKQWVENGGAK